MCTKELELCTDAFSRYSRDSFTQQHVIGADAVLKPVFSNPFSVDLRALALMRIAVGLILLVDLVIRAPDLLIFMSGTGVWPAAASMEYAHPARWSLYWLSQHWLWGALLFVAAGVFALLLAAGVRTRLSTLASFVLLLSLHNYNPFLLQGGDNLLLLLLFWGLFLPWGERLSIEEAVTRSPRTTNNVCLPAGIALLVQVMSVYFFSALLKSGSEWVQDGTAIYYALQNEEFGIRLAPLWRDWHWLTVPLTHYVWWLELLAPLVAFSPLFSARCRTLVFIAFATLEIGFIFNLSVGLFPFISLASLLVLLPTPVLDKLGGRLSRRPKERLELYYDRDCGFCQKTCYVMAYLLGLKNHVSIQAAQDTPDIGELLEREFSWVVQTSEGQRLLRWAAIAHVVGASPYWGWLAAPMRKVEGLGDRLYHWIGLNRSRFGKLTTLLLPWRETYPRGGLLLQTSALVFMVGLLWLNISTVPRWDAVHGIATGLAPHSRVSFPSALDPVKNALRLDQVWNMFAPYPDKLDDWYFMPGLTASGELVDVLHLDGRVPSAKKQDGEYPGLFSDYRWRKYLTRMAARDKRFLRRHYGGWVCRTVNKQRSAADKIVAFNIYLYRQRTPAPGAEKEPPSRIRLWQHHCVDKARLKDEEVEKAL